MNRKINLILITFFSSIILLGCKKNWLDAKPQKNLVVPSTISDFQALLDNTGNIGAPFNDKYNILDEFGAADFYATDAVLDARTPFEDSNYAWAQDTYAGTTTTIEWNQPYQRIFYCNIILDGIEKITPQSNGEQTAWNQVKGSALFFRAFNHYDVARLFCKPFDKNTADADLGIPLRTELDINIVSKRSTVRETYDQIIGDLKASALLLPVQAPINTLYKLRPNLAAVYAMLGRVYLAMSNYDSAFVYADKSLQLYSKLLDYNPLSPSNFPIPAFTVNDEVLFFARSNSYVLFSTSRAIVDSGLYKLYGPNDLRKTIFFKQSSNNIFRFYGHYTSTNSILFTGLATDEVFLIRAECEARKGDTLSAMRDVNTVYQKRWNNLSGPFQRITATDANDALVKILNERRKELCFRGLRWTDLRRLNKESQFATTLTRFYHNRIYTLAPNSPRYVLPIPPDVLQLSGIQPNPR